MEAVKVYNNNAVSAVKPDGREVVLVGAGSELRADGRKAQATCSYARGWFAKHPEAADVLAPDWCDGPEACRLF